VGTGAAVGIAVVVGTGDGAGIGVTGGCGLMPGALVASVGGVTPGTGLMPGAAPPIGLALGAAGTLGTAPTPGPEAEVPLGPHPAAIAAAKTSPSVRRAGFAIRLRWPQQRSR
jgi:hypothetical protein